MKSDRTPTEYVAAVRAAHLDGYGHGQPLHVALMELQAGLKRSHWIWYVFPQILLGTTPMSERFSVFACADVAALLDDQQVRSGLTKAFVLAAGHLSAGATVTSIFAHDDKKVRSSAALFAGYLDGHPRSDCAELHAAARLLKSTADIEVGMCQRTLEFLANC
jgi:uncharacterized protein (DUF1810 family)